MVVSKIQNTNHNDGDDGEDDDDDDDDDDVDDDKILVQMAISKIRIPNKFPFIVQCIVDCGCVGTLLLSKRHLL